MKQKSAICQAIEKVENHYNNYVMHKKDVINILENLKPIEREQIEKGFTARCESEVCKDRNKDGCSCGSEYLKNNFTQE